MNTRSSILALSQSEKIKAGLIWTSQTIEISMGLPENRKQGGDQIISSLLGMVANEIHLGMKVAPHKGWEAALKHINTATVMINSNVIQDAPYHLSKALSQVTGIGQEAMTALNKEGLV